MFSLGCCGNVLKQIVDMSNIPIDLSNSLIFERDIELMIPLLDVSSQQIHVIDAMNVFLNENKELLEEKVGVVQEKVNIIKEKVGLAEEKIDIIKENIESIEEVVQEVVRERSNTIQL